MKVCSYKELIVWQKSVDLALEVYCLLKKFPKEEMYSITSQIKRCSISVASNIAEGWARQYCKEYVQFLYHSLGSCAELETQISIATRTRPLSAIRYPQNHISVQSQQVNSTLSAIRYPLLLEHILQTTNHAIYILTCWTLYCNAFSISQ